MDEEACFRMNEDEHELTLSVQSFFLACGEEERSKMNLRPMFVIFWTSNALTYAKCQHFSKADLWKSNGNESQIVRAEDLCSIFKVPRIEPCNNIWSSIFDVGSTQNAGFTSRPNNYWENDDSGASSLGDWWNGIL
ncbi:hypothetical protein QL285_066920 [Trifolium repens]|nr:hypothetical protein QL285_066920 [Trifolium repens]